MSGSDTPGGSRCSGCYAPADLCGSAATKHVLYTPSRGLKFKYGHICTVNIVLLCIYGEENYSIELFLFLTKELLIRFVNEILGILCTDVADLFSDELDEL